MPSGNINLNISHMNIATALPDCGHDSLFVSWQLILIGLQHCVTIFYIHNQKLYLHGFALLIVLLITFMPSIFYLINLFC